MIETASLTGLMFVVTLVQGVGEQPHPTNDGISAFSTPAVVHFCGVLLIAGVLNAPWHVLAHPAYLAILAGAITLVSHPVEALFVFAGGSGLLIFIGIHNSWDIVTYLAVRRSGDRSG
jgi:hypothetical protein